MNEIVNNFLLAGEIFIPKIHLRQPVALGKPGFTSTACGTLTKNKERIRKFVEEMKDSRCIYQSKLGKVCFRHDMAYEDFKDFPGRTASARYFHDKSLFKYDGTQNYLVFQPVY